MKKFRWGIIGPGRIAQKFAVAIPFSKQGVLQAVASRDAHRARDFAQKYGAAHWYGSYEEMLRSGEIDAVYVATPHPFHLENVLMSLEHRVPVLCEKPLGLNAKEVRQMIDASIKYQTFLMEGMWTRFLPHIIATKEMVDNGAIGQPTILQADFGIVMPFNPEARHYNLALGGGAMVDIGIYPLFLGMYLFDAPTEYCGYATLSPTGSDASLVMALRFNHGVLGSFYASYQAYGRLEADIVGTQGRIKLHSNWFRPAQLELIDLNGKSTTIQFSEPSNGFQHEMDEVAECVKAGLKQSEAFPLQFSLRMAEIMDHMRRHFGVKYAGE